MSSDDSRPEKKGPGRPRTEGKIRAKAVQLRRSGHSWTEIAGMLGIGRTTARRLCQKPPLDGETPNPPKREKRVLARVRRRE